MSDDDRLTDYIARIENPNHVRTLPDACTCGKSGLSCRATRYLHSTPCCGRCCHD